MIDNKDRKQLLTELVGKDIPAADGGNYGIRVFGLQEYDDGDFDVLVQEINWKTGDPLGPIRDIDAFKMSYRYDEESAREAKVESE